MSTVSIIIPTRNRNRNVALCLWSIQRSASLCGTTDYEVIVVDNGSKVPPQPDSSPNVTILCDQPNTDIFNKPRCLNVGIEAARGDVLCFLDADTLVADRWFDGLKALDDSSLTRLCYRVRYLPLDTTIVLERAVDRDTLLSGWFADYDTYPPAREAYGTPDGFYAKQGAVFGNSQWAIHRNTLGDIRWDEQYVGRGYEDIPLARTLWYHYGKQYRAALVTDGQHALFHIKNTLGTADWYNPGFATANQRRYNATANRQLETSLRTQGGGP